MKMERAFMSACGSLSFKPDNIERKIMDKKDRGLASCDGKITIILTRFPIMGKSHG